MAPPRIRRGGKKLPPGAGRTAAAAKKAQAEAAAAAAAASNPDALEKAPQMLDPENETGDATVSMEVDQESQDAKAWIKQNVEQEIVRSFFSLRITAPLSKGAAFSNIFFGSMKMNNRQG